jgi:hypothetical protein
MGSTCGEGECIETTGNSCLPNRNRGNFFSQVRRLLPASPVPSRTTVRSVRRIIASFASLHSTCPPPSVSSIIVDQAFKFLWAVVYFCWTSSLIIVVQIYATTTSILILKEADLIHKYLSEDLVTFSSNNSNLLPSLHSAAPHTQLNIKYTHINNSTYHGSQLYQIMVDPTLSSSSAVAPLSIYNLPLTGHLLGK